MKPTICILYGFAEGPVTGKTFQRACEQAGHTVVNDPAQADIIFAHSGGCYLVPAGNQAPLIIMVGLPYWPGRPLLVSLAIKAWREFRRAGPERPFIKRLRKLWYQMRYAAAFTTVRQMAQNRRPSSPWNNRQPQIIIRNRYDAYCSSDIVALPFKGPRTFISLPGEHDDCWDNPDPYINLIQSSLHGTELLG